MDKTTKSQKTRIAIIGDTDSIMLFQAVGIDTISAEDTELIEKSIHRLAKMGYKVIYLTEQAAEKVPELIKEYKTQPFPAIIPVPNRTGSIGLGMRGIKQNVEKAIGADIL